MKKRILILTVCVVCFLSLFSISAFAETSNPRLVDNAGLLSEDEYETVLEKLDTTSENLNFDIVVVTTDSVGSKTVTEYADDFYDYNGYGYGSDRDGAVLLISMEDRSWWISACGEGKYSLSKSKCDSIGEDIIEYLSEGDYENAFIEFADCCGRYVVNYRNGDADTDYSYGKEPLSILAIPVSLVIGFIIAFIVVAVMKGKLKSVKFQTAADNYVKEGSMNITESRDLFLYRTVSRVAKPKNDDSSSDGGFHSSSSGTSHGGSGGHF